MATSMATENGTKGPFNICFGGVLGVGKTTLFEYLKSGKFVEKSSDEARDTGVDVSRLEREVDGTKIKVKHSGRHACSPQLICVFIFDDRCFLSSGIMRGVQIDV